MTYEDINLTLTLHKNIANLLRIFSKAYYHNDNDTYNDILSIENNKTSIEVSKKKIQDYLSHEITNSMKLLATDIIKDEEQVFAEPLKHVIKKLLNEVIDIEEKESLK